MTWTTGKCGSVVATEPYEGMPYGTGHSDVDYYGGYLIAESIPTVAIANLIAAAPDMLEALENIENDDKHMPSTAWEMIQDAIRKAKEGK